jgi:DNA-binding MarR family transcriptional regulator
VASAVSEHSSPSSELGDGVEEHLRTPFDATLSDANRLRIQAALHGLTAGGSIRFTALAKALNLSDGNLAAHLAVMSEVGYVTVRSTYAGKRRTRWYSASAAGREAFEAHVRALQSVIDSARLGSGDNM